MKDGSKIYILKYTWFLTFGKENFMGNKKRLKMVTVTAVLKTSDQRNFRMRNATFSRIVHQLSKYIIYHLKDT